MLTDAQKVTLAAAIRASVDPTVVAALAIRDDVALWNWCNANSTAVVWKTLVSLGDIGKTFVATALADITSANTDKLHNYAAWNPAGCNPSRADTRAFFDDVFSVAAGASTRTALLALWKRFATNAENVFATGTKTDATPGLLVFEGAVGLTELSQALNAPV